MNLKHFSRNIAEPHGMTLVELMIVVVIIAVISLIAYPNVMGVVEEKRVAERAQEIIYFMNDSRLQANLRNKAVFITITVAGATNGQLVADQLKTTNCVANAQAVDKLYPAFRTYQFPSEPGTTNAIKLDSSTVGGLAITKLCMKPNGKVLDGTTSLELANSVIFAVSRYKDTTKYGVTRKVSLSYSGVARTEL